MTTKELKSVNDARPFKPYTLELADGSRVEVPHPEFVLITPGGRTIVVATSDDSLKIIDLLLVSAISVGNGSSKRSRKRK
jgi:hypothetical protein